MKIPGLLNYEVDLRLKEGTGTLIEFKVIHNNRPIYNADIMDFDEIKYDLEDILSENDLFLPDYRMEKILERLEEKYLILTQEKQEITDSYRKQEQKIMESLSSNINRLNQRKVVLVGLQGAGKTSIYRVIFENKLPHETHDIKPTKGVERHSLNLFQKPGDHQVESDEVFDEMESELFIWDLGGQHSFFEKYYEEPEFYFNETDVLIFTIDASDVGNYEKAQENLHRLITILEERNLMNSMLNLEENVFCFIHKMDNFPNREEKYVSLKKYFREVPEDYNHTKRVIFLSTSIYDSSIHTAWTKVMQKIMPKSSKLNLMVQDLKNDLGLFAAFMIEKRTGLPLCSSKTLLDESALVGSTNRILISIERVLPEFQLTGVKNMSIETKNGLLHIILFNEYYLLVLLSPPANNLNTLKSKKIIEDFISDAKSYI